MVVASAGRVTAPARHPALRAGSVARAVAAHTLPPIALLAFTALVFFDELVGASWAYGRDTTAFYYPLTEWAAQELKQGRLPFWLPLIFAGYPLLADGEVGALYPPNLLLLATMPTPLAYGWLRAFHYAVAALGLFALARALRVGPFGAVVGGLSFAYGSFMVGHLQHDNIVRSAAWLPCLLFAAELALRARGPGQVLWTCIGGFVLALQSLGLHIQPVLLSLMALAAYLLAGPLGPGAGRGLSPGSWLRVRLRVGLGIIGLGLGLASAQLLPLYVLGQESLRPALVTYAYATSYAVAPLQVLTLIFPYMFHFDAERSWALWSTYESTLYAGVVPLVLAIVAVGFLRTRAVLFFAALALASLVLCMGDYLPVKSYTVIWNLPGFAFLRAPARFSLLLELAIACLAALAVDWLGRRAAAVPRPVALTSANGPAVPSPLRSAERAPGLPRGLEGLLWAMPVVAVGLAILFQGVRWALQRYPSPALDLFQWSYLETDRENWALGPWHVYYGILEFTRPDNARTAFGIFLLVAAPLLIRAWLRRPRLAIAWRTALALLVTVDLWLFVGGFHPRAHLDELRPGSPALGYLAGQPGPFRLFVEPSLNQSLGPNQLVSSGLATVNGYSSLEPRRLSEYWWSMVMQDNFLLDLFNVRYVLAGHRIPGQRTYQDTRYHPSDRLMSGEAGNRAGQEEFRFGPIPVESVTVVAAVEDLPAAADGAPVAELTLSGGDGQQRIVTLHAGQDLTQYEAVDPGRPTADYVGPRVIWSGPSFAPNRTSQPVRLYGTTAPISPPLDVTGVTIRALTSTARLHVHGLGLRTAEGVVYSVRSTDNAKYRTLYEDANVLLLENTSAWPRAFVVGGAVQARPDAPIVEQLLERSWDPAREILVEGASPTEIHHSIGSESIGTAELLSYEPTRVVVRAVLAAPGYLVLADRHDIGWRATSDGQELPILRANGIQRAVPLPVGSHVVTFRYDPWWIKLGFALSGLAAAATIVALAVAFRSFARGEGTGEGAAALPR